MPVYIVNNCHILLYKLYLILIMLQYLLLDRHAVIQYFINNKKLRMQLNTSHPVHVSLCAGRIGSPSSTSIALHDKS